MESLHVQRSRLHERKRKYFTHLPDEILELIFSNLGVVEKRAVRASCRRCWTIENECRKRLFRGNYNNNQRAIKDKCIPDQKCALNTAIQAATAVYCLRFNYGFVLHRFLFTEQIKSAINGDGIFIESVPFETLRDRLLSYFEFVHTALLAADPTDNLVNKAYFLVLIELLGQFEVVKWEQSLFSPNYLSVMLEVDRVWFNIVWKRKRETIRMCASVDDRYHVLVVLSNMLYAELMHECVTSVWTVRNKVIVYGRQDECTGTKNSPKIRVKITAVGSNRVIQSLMQQRFSVDMELFLTEDCCIFMDISSLNSDRWGYPSDLNLNVC